MTTQRVGEETTINRRDMRKLAVYLLPQGHPAPLMVQRPGSYETRDHLRFGAGLVAITLLVVAVLVPPMLPF